MCLSRMGEHPKQHVISKHALSTNRLWLRPRKNIYIKITGVEIESLESCWHERKGHEASKVDRAFPPGPWMCRANLKRFFSKVTALTARICGGKSRQIHNIHDLLFLGYIKTLLKTNTWASLAEMVSGGTTCLFDSRQKSGVCAMRCTINPR